MPSSGTKNPGGRAAQALGYSKGLWCKPGDPPLGFLGEREDYVMARVWSFVPTASCITANAKGGETQSTQSLHIFL